MSEELSILSLVLLPWPRCAAGDGDFGACVCFLLGCHLSTNSRVITGTKTRTTFEDTFWSGAELVGLYKQVANSPNLIGLEAVFKAGFQEFTRLRQDVKSDPDAVMEGVHRAMRVACKGRRAS